MNVVIDDSARKSAFRAGFTLIELSIVLVIIGLIVGGVLAGRDLIHAATLRSVITDIDRFNAATLTFEGKYNCVPGDCVNATDLFGTYSGCWHSYLIPVGNGTCNGDGDNKVKRDSYATNYAYLREPTLFWQQLSVAGLVAGTYGGALNGDGGITPGSNAPASKVENGCYSVDYSDDAADISSAPRTGMNAHFFALGNSMGQAGAGPALPSCVAGLKSLMAVDAQSIDTKIDDGRPITGNVQSVIFLLGGIYNFTAGGGCLAGDAVHPETITYDSATAYTPCQLLFKAAF